MNHSEPQRPQGLQAYLAQFSKRELKAAVVNAASAANISYPLYLADLAHQIVTAHGVSRVFDLPERELDRAIAAIVNATNATVEG